MKGLHQRIGIDAPLVPRRGPVPLRGILEVLDAQRLLRSVRLDYLNAQFDRQAALVDLDELRGVDLRRSTP